ncbi:MAG: aldo/keto reductase [Beijerinckiaceae bacterium]|nr:aldo/keto reductase [Beijerinckiaceae bacterium]
MSAANAANALLTANKAVNVHVRSERMPSSQRIEAQAQTKARAQKSACETRKCPMRRLPCLVLMRLRMFGRPLQAGLLLPATRRAITLLANRRRAQEETPMHYRSVPCANLTLSEIAFGCGGNAGLMVRGTVGEQESAVARTLELGVTYFDNSPDYGNCVAEENLGRALKSLRARPIINTKVEIRAENLGDVAAHVVQSAEDSLRRLGVEHIDVFQIHNGPTTRQVMLEGRDYKQLPLEDYLGGRGALEGLRRLKAAGKIGCAGFICRGGDGAEVRQLIETNEFAVINAPYTLLNPSAGEQVEGGSFSPDYGDVISFARTHGVGVAVYAPLAGGFLSDDSIEGVPAHAYARAPREGESTNRNRAKAKAVRFLAEETGMSLAQVAYRFILSNPGVTAALGGFSSIAQMEEVIEVSGMQPFPADLMARLQEVWRANFGLQP